MIQRRAAPHGAVQRRTATCGADGAQTGAALLRGTARSVNAFTLRAVPRGAVLRRTARIRRNRTRVKYMRHSHCAPYGAAQRGIKQRNRNGSD